MGKANGKIAGLWNQISDSDWYRGERTDDVIGRIIDRPQRAFHPTTWEVILQTLPELKGRRVCVPSSGDNHAAFAFALLGARVTSCDISKRQLENAAEIAAKHHWDIEFIQDDTMELGKIRTGQYDLVYTSNGVHVWIGDLPAMYGAVHRIMKPGGAYVMYDIHPVVRPFPSDTLILEKPYGDIGPFDGMQYHWRTQDIVNAIASAGLVIRRMEEMFDDRETGSFWFRSSEDKAGLTPDQLDATYDWKTNPLAGLPNWLTLCAVK